MRVAVIGLGLIGGSLARDLAAAGHEILASDVDATALRSARRARVIRGILPPDLTGVEECDLCVIALPVDATRALLRRSAGVFLRTPIVTDVGSTKESIVRAARAAGLSRHFVGGHPLAGYHRSGWRASREGLFAGRRVYLTPTSHTAPDAVRVVHRFWRELGATVERIDAAAHDRLVAVTSHLPQVVATALAAVMSARRIPRAALGTGGRDMTRLAASNPAVWGPILINNQANLAPAIARLKRELGRVERALRANDERLLGRTLQSARRWSDTE